MSARCRVLLVAACALAPCQAEEPNAADDYREVAALVDFPKFETDRALWNVLREGWECAHPELEVVLEKNGPALERMRAIGEWKRCEFLPGADVSFDTKSPHHFPVRNLAAIAALKGRHDASQGALADAAAWYLRVVRLARGIANERFLVSRMMETAVLETATDGLLDLVRAPSCGAETLREIDRVLADYLADHRPLALAIELDRQMVVGALDRVFLTAPGLDASSPPSEQSELTDAIRKGDQETRRRWRDKCRELLDDWYARARAASAPGNHGDLPALEEEGRAARDEPQDPAEQFFGLVAQGLGRPVSVASRSEAILHGIRILGAVARFRLDTGNPPATLADLVPKYLPSVPNDPFDGKPLRYAVDGQGCRVWSVGRDLVDDGGKKPADPGMVEPGTDVLLELE